MQGSPARYFIHRMVRRIGRGYWVGDVIMLVGFTLWFSVSPLIGFPLVVVGVLFFLITARYQFKAWCLLHRMERDGSAASLYEEMALPESIHSSQTNTIITKSFVVSVGGKTGFTIVKTNEILDAHIHVYRTNRGETKDIVVRTRDGRTHRVAFFHANQKIPMQYNDVLSEILKRIPKNNE